MIHHFVKRTWCRGQDPLEWADMRRRLSGKVENDGLLLRVLRSSGQLTLFIVESEGWWFCWWRWSPGCWSRSMMSTSFTQAALCLATPKISYDLNLSWKHSLLCEGDLRSKFALLQRKSLAGPGNNYITSEEDGLQISVIITFLNVWNTS